MTDYRSEAEKFVTEFLDYVYKYDILDSLNKQTQRMERSPGVHDLVKKAEGIFPQRKPGGHAATEMRNLSDEQRGEAIAAAPNVVDTRQMFATKIAEHGGARGILFGLLDGNEEAADLALEFYAAEKGEKEFNE